ncbi:MAG: hemerythrin domain-containing protein [Muribaculaceae bacterium]|nr:hemerythrin domain-containing protein [Muribaculaceae bacterium]
MVKMSSYNQDDKMITIITNQYNLIHVLSRFGIPLGFNDKTIKEVCKDAKVDCNTFLAIVNFLNDSSDKTPDISFLSLESLLHYLKQSHIYFLNFYLPSIRRKLLDSITLKASDVSFLILKLFDEYVEEIRAHMEEEEHHLFKTVEDAITGTSNNEKRLPVYSQHHEEVASKLREVKNIIIKYCPADSNANLLNDALYDIFRCEEELESHCRIEDLLLLPAIKHHINNLKK